jgi:hypothetical protein
MLVAAALGAAWFAPSATAQSLTNGDFETYQGAAGPSSIRTQLSDGDTSVDGWTHGSPNGAYDIYEDDSQDGLTAYNGTHYVSFGHNGTTGGTLSQSFASVLGTIYTLGYHFAEQQGSDPTGSSFDVWIDGVLTGNSGDAVYNVWNAGSVTFKGTGNMMSILFQDATTSGGASNLALDGVSLNGSSGSSLPEPGTWAMMLAGMAVAGLAMRRQSAKVGATA